MARSGTLFSPVYPFTILQGLKRYNLPATTEGSEYIELSPGGIGRSVFLFFRNYANSIESLS